MKYLNKIAALACFFALGLTALTSCEGGDLYGVNSPSWISDKVDSIRNASQGEEEEELEGMHEDVYTVGAPDFSTGWWAVFSKYYQIPQDEVWNAVFNLSINPNASNTYKNFALIICNDEDRGAADYKEYGAIRFDNQPSGNSEWGDYIDRSLVQSNLTFGSDTDPGVDKLGGRVVLTIDRSEGGLFVKITNGTVTKTYTQTASLVNLNADKSNNTIRAFLVPEGSCINWLQSNLEPIGGFTEAGDKLPLKLTLNSVPKKILQNAYATVEEAFANVTATVEFEQGVTAEVTAADLTFQAVPDLNSLGVKTLVAAYSKTYKGEGAPAPVIGSAQFEVVDKMYTLLGAADNSTPFWGAHTENIQVKPNETFISTFTNYTSGANNWNNFCVVLCTADGSTEYAVVRADNYGWGTGYDACTHEGTQGDWATWLAAMDGAKVTLAVTNNGNGTADIEAIMLGSNGETYTQVYKGINNVDPSNCYFNLTVDNCHLEFDDVVGEEDNTSPFWGAHSEDVYVPVGKTVTQRFKNFTSGANNWNNFCVVLTREDNSEYAVVRADNFGWGASYDGNTSLVTSGGQADWGAWLAAMDDALVTVSTTNKGGSVDIDIVMKGNNGVEYTQYYHNITPTDGDNVRVRFTVDGCHLVFE